jgi:hypothetical protein
MQVYKSLRRILSGNSHEYKNGKIDNIFKDDFCKKFVYSILKEKIKIYLKNNV